jgi:hypothetical protein
VGINVSSRTDRDSLVTTMADRMSLEGLSRGRLKSAIRSTSVVEDQDEEGQYCCFNDSSLEGTPNRNANQCSECTRRAAPGSSLRKGP